MRNSQKIVRSVNSRVESTNSIGTETFKAKKYSHAVNKGNDKEEEDENIQ
jgi:hypothetical protein